MTKLEFEDLIGDHISDKDYQVVEFVYQFHPCIEDKMSIAKIYEAGGMQLIRSMQHVAVQGQKLDEEMMMFRGKIDHLKKLREQLKETGECEEVEEEQG